MPLMVGLQIMLYKGEHTVGNLLLGLLALSFTLFLLGYSMANMNFEEVTNNSEINFIFSFPRPYSKTNSREHWVS